MNDEPNALEQVAERLGLSRFDVAQMLDATPGIVDAWLSGAMAPGPISRRRLDDLLIVLESLFERMSPWAARVWLTLPNPDLDYYEPIDLLRRGDLYTIMEYLRSLPPAIRLDQASAEHVAHELPA